jgi:hypothetical protein
MKFLTLVFLTFAASFAHADCPMSFATEGLCAKIEWTKGPQAGVPSAFRLTFWKESDNTAADPKKTLFIKTWMEMANGHDHGGPKVKLVKIQTGQYEVNDLKLFGGMKGTWFLLLQLLDGETKVEEIKYAVDLKE